MKKSTTPSVKTAAPTLLMQLLALQMINLNGTEYLGQVEKDGDKISVSNASPIFSNLETSVKEWIKAKNLDKLQSFTLEGNNTSLIRKDFNEEQQMQIGIIAAKAEYGIKYALANLQNNSF